MTEPFKNIHQDIINKCRKGNEKAQFELYRLYYRPMYNVSLRIVNNEVEAEDIMQESFLKAFRKLDTYKGEVSFGAWLRKIVINSSLDYLKKRKVRFDQLNEKIIDDSDDDEVGEVNIDLLKKAVRSLSDNYRTILSLYLFEGYDHEEISEILNISNVTSRIQYSRAKCKLRELLKGKEIILYK